MACLEVEVRENMEIMPLLLRKCALELMYDGLITQDYFIAIDFSTSLWKGKLLEFLLVNFQKQILCSSSSDDSCGNCFALSSFFIS